MEKNTPLVSILIPVYNRESLVREAIESAINQTYQNIEVIICDNRSTDNTFEVCLEYAKSDSRVKVFQNEENLGPVKNWIQCVKAARGEFSKILFSDDLLAPNCVEEMLNELNNSEIGFVSSFALIGTKPFEGYLCYNSGLGSRFSSREWLKFLLSDSAPVSPGALLFRTSDLRISIWSEIPTSTPRPYEKNGAGPDLLISLLMLEKYKFVSRVNKPLVFFRAHSGSFTIENLNNSVSLGYQSTFAYFLHSRKYWFEWLIYNYKNWVQRKGQNADQTLTSFLRAYEGKGDVFELFWFSLIFFYSKFNLGIAVFKTAIRPAIKWFKHKVLKRS